MKADTGIVEISVSREFLPHARWVLEAPRPVMQWFLNAAELFRRTGTGEDVPITAAQFASIQRLWHKTVESDPDAAAWAKQNLKAWLHRSPAELDGAR